METGTAWAENEFGAAELGDVRRTRRLIKIAASFADRPRGLVTQVVSSPAEREAAFRFVENDAIEAAAVARVHHAATARRCSSASVVVVPVDQATLTVTDRVGKSGFGRTGPNASSSSTAGFQVMTAIAVGPDGSTQGVLAQQWWARLAKSPEYKRDRRPAAERESDLWRRTIVEADEVLAVHAPGVRPWYQLDRGGDCGAVLEMVSERDLLVTIRSAYNRKLASGARLHTSMRRAPVLGHHLVDLGDGTSVRLTIRAATHDICVADLRGRARGTLRISCVHAREARPPRGRARLEWWLLTTASVARLEDALEVVRNYTRRWRIEEFHRAWKSGVCNIEQSQLRSARAFQRWATIGAAVAARAERLKHLSRTHGELDAEQELSRAEIDAAIVLSRTKRYGVGAVITLEQAVALIAAIGGYTGKSSGGPPGVRVIQRGLEEVIVGARLLDALRRSG